MISNLGNKCAFVLFKPVLNTLSECRNLGGEIISLKAFVWCSLNKNIEFYKSEVQVYFCLFFSTPQEISMYAQVTHQKAEEIYRYIHYIFDMQMLPPDPNRGSIKSDT